MVILENGVFVLICLVNAREVDRETSIDWVFLFIDFGLNLVWVFREVVGKYEHEEG